MGGSSVLTESFPKLNFWKGLPSRGETVKGISSSELFRAIRSRGKSWHVTKMHIEVESMRLMRLNAASLGTDNRFN
jgi:hypothetical protein